MKTNRMPRWLPFFALVFPLSPINAQVAATNAQLPSLHAGSAPFEAPTSRATASAFGAPMQSDTLDAQRGGADTTLNTTIANGNVGGNRATNVDTGSNIIDGDAFSGSSGLSTVIQNSGTNVLIQNGTVVNVQFANPSP